VRTSKSEQCGLRPDFVEEVCDGVDLCEWPDCNYLDYPRFDEMLGELYAIPVECDSSEFVDVCGNENEEVVDVFVRRGPEEPTRRRIRAILTLRQFLLPLKRGCELPNQSSVV
jgi:hypothetical protein